MASERIKPWIERGKTFCVAFVALLVCGIITSPLVDRVWPRVRATQPELNLIDLQDALGQGILVGAFGGFRSLIADIVWIAGNADWEKSDRPKVETMIKLANTLDPTNSFFWRNGARILAYDIPVWRLREAKLDTDDRKGEAALTIRREQAERAIALLDTVIARDPNNAWPLVEKAQIYNLVLKNPEMAAKYFKEAAERPNAPYFAARIYAELLIKLDHKREAYAYLRKLYDDLPKEDKFAARDIVYERLRALEEELKIPEAERYHGAPPPDVVIEKPGAASAPPPADTDHSK